MEIAASWLLRCVQLLATGAILYLESRLTCMCLGCIPDYQGKDRL